MRALARQDGAKAPTTNRPTTLLLQGLHDHITSVDDVPVVYVPLPAVEHAFDLCLPRVSPPAQSALYDVERFLAVV